MENKVGQIRDKVEAMLKEENISLLDFKVSLVRGSYVLRCIIDYPLGGVTMDKCAQINKNIFFYLKESNILGEEYSIEVSSPGLDRPLKESRDFLNKKGRFVMVWLKETVLGKEYIEGEVAGVEADNLKLVCKGEIVNISFDKIKVGKEKILTK